MILTVWRSWRIALVVALALLLGVRSIVPTGYMVDTSGEDGQLIIRMCGGMGDRFMSFNPSTGALTPVGKSDGPSPAAPDADDEASSCPFALTALADVPRSPTVVIAGLFGPPLMAARPVPSAPTDPAFLPVPPVRGPPALS